MPININYNNFKIGELPIGKTATLNCDKQYMTSNVVIDASLTTELNAKADKVTNATNGNFASLDSTGNLIDSGYKGSDITSHTTNTSNPHSVTKTQVGLGNVPNVATNDQTPTYSAASTLATLTSGEKLSVSMGKIMKAITDFISHKGSTSNPHSVTKS